jgi:hypothetical protein
MVQTYSDLSGLFFIQQQYLSDLSALSGGGTSVAGYLTDLASNLNSAYNNFPIASASANYTLDHQSDMKNIVDEEQKRLLAKQQSVDNAIFGQNRMADFNNSYTQKYLYQSKIIIAIIIAVLLYLVLLILNRAISLPSALINIIFIVIFLVTTIYIITITYEINRRYNMDFNKLKLNPPPIKNTSTIGGNTQSSSLSFSLGNLGVCIGESCCNDGTGLMSWDSKTNTCQVIGNAVPVSGNVATRQGFENISAKNTNLAVNGTYTPYGPSEINKYTKI